MTKTKKFALGCCAALMLLAPGFSMAATINVPGDHATISAAVAAAANGDTVLITDSSIYAEAVQINKPITLMAAPGQSPVIRGAGETASYIIRTVTGADGAQIGSNAGGRIILDPNAAVGPVRYLSPEHSGGAGVVTFENLLVRNPPLPAIQTMMFTRPINCESIYQDIEIDGNNRLHLIMDCRLVEGKKTTFNRMYVHGMRQQTGGGFGFYSSALLGDIEINQSEITTFREFVVIDGGPETDVYTIKIDRSYLEMTVDGNWDMFDARYNASLHITNSVLNCQSQGQAVRWLTGDNTDNIIEHCDIITRNNHALRIYEGVGRTFSIKNNNFSSEWASAYSIFVDVPGAETYDFDYNNAATPNNGYMGIEPPAGPNDITPPVIPTYTNVAQKNYIATNPELYGTGEGGSNIGANCNFFQIYLNPDPCPSLVPEPPTSARGDWALYM